MKSDAKLTLKHKIGAEAPKHTLRSTGFEKLKAEKTAIR